MIPADFEDQITLQMHVGSYCSFNNLLLYKHQTWYIPEVGDDPYLFLGHKVKVQESNCFIYNDHIVSSA